MLEDHCLQIVCLDEEIDPVFFKFTNVKIYILRIEHVPDFL